VEHYINMGRWADNIIGPFDTHDAADAYIETVPWRGARPTIVTIQSPRKPKWRVRFTLTADYRYGPPQEGSPTPLVEVIVTAPNKDDALVQAREILGNKAPPWRFWNLWHETVQV